MFKVLNNTEDYEVALHGLRITISLGIKHLIVRGYSTLVVNQVNKMWQRMNEKMDAYCTEICKLEGKFFGLEFQHVVHDDNKVASQYGIHQSQSATWCLCPRSDKTLHQKSRRSSRPIQRTRQSPPDRATTNVDLRDCRVHQVHHASESLVQKQEGDASAAGEDHS